MVKKYIKKIFRVTNTLPFLDRLMFLAARFKYYSSNQQFKKEHPGFPLPPDYYLYETYRLHYDEYREDGTVTAEEIVSWTKKYGCRCKAVLDWGCGVARVVRHMPEWLDAGSRIDGADINEGMIKWDNENIPGIRFSVIGTTAPMHYADASFDMVYALSVFTHIEDSRQEEWLGEIHRILQPKGLFLFTTHGRHFTSQLLPAEQQTLSQQGSFTISYQQKGHRMMTTYNQPAHFRSLLEKSFVVLEYTDGASDPAKIGGQDLWIVQKK